MLMASYVPNNCTHREHTWLPNSLVGVCRMIVFSISNPFTIASVMAPFRRHRSRRTDRHVDDDTGGGPHLFFHAFVPECRRWAEPLITLVMQTCKSLGERKKKKKKFRHPLDCTVMTVGILSSYCNGKAPFVALSHPQFLSAVSHDFDPIHPLIYYDSEPRIEKRTGASWR